MYRLGARSKRRMRGLHPDLVRVVERAIQLTPVDFTVLEGMRTRARQEKLVAIGASKTMNSRHLTGHAIDIAPWGDFDSDGDIDGEDLFHHWPLYHRLADAMKEAARELDVPIEWGGDWRSFKDGPHFQLPWRTHPA